MLYDPKIPERLVLGRRVYLIKPPTVSERGRYRRMLAERGVRRHSSFALLDALAAALKRLMDDSPAREAWLAAIEAHRANLMTLAEFARESGPRESELSDADKERLKALSAASAESEARLDIPVREVRDADAVFSRLEADNQRYWPDAGQAAAEMFLMGWEGIETQFVRAGRGVAESVLAAIPEGDFPDIGLFMEDLMALSERQRKNSSSPSSMPAGGSTLHPGATAMNGTALN